MKKILLPIFIFIFVMTGSIYPSTTGKISGIIKDSKTGEPLIGANILINGTSFGAASNVDGYYVILNVPPGTYTLKASMIGYTSQSIIDVRVNIDQTTAVDFELTETSFETEEVVIVAKNPIVQKDVSSSRVNLNITEIENLPVVSAQRVITLQAGIQGGSEGPIVRGGGSDQTAFMVNGITLRDERNNTPYTGISFTSIEEIQVQTGGFNAEFGNIRSGVVNVVTKEGSKDKYYVSFLGRYRAPAPKHMGVSPNSPDAYWIRPFIDDDVAWVGTREGWADNPYLQAQYPEFDGWIAISEQTLQDTDPTNDLTPFAAQQLYLFQHRRELDIKDPDYDVDLSFGGPMPLVGKYLGDMRFFASFRQNENQYLIPLSRQALKDYSYQLKLTSDITTGMKLMIEGLMARTTGTTRTATGESLLFTSPEQIASALSLFSQFKTAENRVFAPDYWTPAIIDRNSIAAKLTHVLNPTTFYEVSLARFQSDYDSNPDRLRDTSKIYQFGSYFVDEGPFGFQPNPSNGINNFRMGVGFSNSRDTSKVVSYNIKFDITSQLDKYNNIKAGFEFNYTDHNVRSGSIDIYLPSGRFITNWRKFPVRGALYVQDKFEYEGLIANLGVRLDYSNAGGEWYVWDPFTSAFSSAKSQGVDTLLEKESTKKIVTLSPRLGVAFPITENSKLFFNYGHFRQLPDPLNLYLFRRFLDNNQVTRVANPNNPLPKTVAYELGYEQNLLDQFLIRLAGYYKDVSDQPLLINYVSRDGKVNYNTSEPLSYEDIRGFEATISKNRGAWIQGFLNYTYMVSTSGRFGFSTIYENRTEQDRYERINLNNPSQGPAQSKPIPRPYARANVDIFTPKEFGPQVGGVFLLEDLRLNILASWVNGQYFTWTGGSGSILGVENNVQWTDYYNVDLRLSKSFSIGPANIQLFMDVSNVFNIKRMTGPGYAFIDNNDYLAYMKSLHLPQDAFENFPKGVDGTPQTGYANWEPASGDYGDLSRFVFGDDRPGDYRTGDYIPWDESASESQKEEWRKNKSYIDMPNQDYLTFLNPRDIFWGLRVSIDIQ